MKYSTEIIINLPREKVLELFDSTDNLYKWQPTLKSFEHLSGAPGMEGAKSRLIYIERGKELEMTETITKRNLPEEFSGLYETKGVKNTLINDFHEEGPNSTRWVTVSEFKFSGFMKFIAIFMRRAFPKQTLKTMNQFKEFAENS